ncbi:MAG: histidinol dehydrogenase [Spirochaetaceae bacterium]|nr:histidinol dehydrogenase [Spirochaetaceae bacterium]
MSTIKNISCTEIPDSFYSSERLSSTQDTANTTEKVMNIISRVKTGGDAAIHEFAAQFDRANPEKLEVSEEDIKNAQEKLKKNNPKLYEALCLSRDLAIKFATRQKESFDNFEMEISPGLFTGQRTLPVERAGIYVPAGRFPLLSSVIMCLTPAKAAGVSETILCTPPRPHPDGSGKAYADEGILAAAGICGADKVFACGGAQAIAALAYGTETIPRCDVIAGPGNKFVAEAKKLVYGQCGIDMIAGPTEVMIIADKSANPAWVAADMLAQAEHDKDAQAVLITDSNQFAKSVEAELEKQLKTLSTAETAAESLKNNGYIITVDNLDQAADIANRKAPEHLELALDSGEVRDKLAKKVHNYGSLFIGHETAEVLGDYAAGLNHTLPTAGSARFTGGLSVRHFLKTVTTLRSSGKNGSGWKNSIDAAETLGHTEGLEGHAAAAHIRK